MTTEQTTITPVGTVIAYHATTAPEGYFACDGAEFDADVYPKLAAVLGKNSVPDLRGYFIRGYGPNNDKDPDSATRKLCSEQRDAIRNITGKTNLTISPGPTGGVGKGTQVVLWSGDFGAIYPIKTNVTGGNYITTSGTITGESSGNGFGFDASRQVPVADEIRPINVTLLYCIKHDEPETLPVPEKASTAETVTGEDDAKYVTPAGVAAAIAAQPAPQPVTPDLRLERETPWPMRYKGKQVYARLVDFGTLPVAYGMKMFSHLIPDIEWCQVAWDYSTIRGGSATQSADAVTLGLVSTPPGALNMQWRVFMDKNAIHAHSLTNNANTAWSAEVCVLYTKTTDEPLP